MYRSILSKGGRLIRASPSRRLDISVRVSRCGGSWGEFGRSLSVSASALASADPSNDGKESWFASKAAGPDNSYDFTQAESSFDSEGVDASGVNGGFDIVDLSEKPGTDVQDIVEDLASQDTEQYADVIRSMTWVEDWTMRFPSPLGWVGSRVLDAHDMLGLEWWASIAAVSVLFRAAYLPIAISQQAMGSRSRTIQVATKQSTEMLKELASGGGAQVDPKVRLDHFKQMSELRKKAGVSPIRMLLPMFVLIPGSIFVFQGMRHLSEAATRIPGMESGGLPWAPDLSVPDPYFILPALSLVGAGISAAISRKTNEEMARYSPPALNPDTIFTGLVGMQLLFAPIMAGFPLGLQILFCSTSWTLMLTPLLARQPFIHSMFKFAPGWPNHVKQIPPAGMTQREADLKALEIAEESAAYFLPYMGGLQGVAQRFTRRKGQSPGADNPNYVGLFGTHSAGPPPPPLHVVAASQSAKSVAEEVAANVAQANFSGAQTAAPLGSVVGAGASSAPAASSGPVRRKRRKGKRR